MQRSLIPIFIMSPFLFFLWSCASPVEQAQTTHTTQIRSASYDHKTPRDSVNWTSLSRSGHVPEVKETDLEWPGERLGLIGPIIATGGDGGDQFIIVFDPAGIPVGLITRKAYKKDPSKLADLLARAQVRSKIQNLATLVHLFNKEAAVDRPAGRNPDLERRMP